jgi:hypothetical protein
MKIKATLAGALSALLLTAGAVGVMAPAASADTDGTCVPSDAWTETVVDTPAVPAVDEVSHMEYQRYSWTGGPTDTAPTATPPGEDWQAKTTNYEGAGHGTDPIGVAFQRDKPGKGNADWFFWVGTKVIDTPAQDAVPAVTHDVDHPAVTCEQPPAPPTIGQCDSTGATLFTSLADWTMTETRATGHNDLVDGGLHVWTEGATSTDKAAGYYPASFDLKDAGSGFGVTATGTGSAQPSLQMLVDLDGNGSPEGYLVAEPVYGADTLWLSSNWTHIDLSAAPTTVNGGGTGKGGTANAWLAAFPNAHVSAIGYSLGSGVLGDWTITAITAGCHVYTFDRPEAPAIPTPTTVTTTGDWMGGEPTCDEPSVEQTRTVTTVTTTYAAPQWVGNAWVEDTTGVAGEPVVTTESRTATYQGDDCAVVIPPTPTPTPTVTPAVTPQPTVAPTVKTPHVQEVVHGDLAETGGTINPYALSIGALLLAAGIGVIVIAVARSKRA